MRVIHLVGYFGNYQGGIQSYVKELAERQAFSGLSVKIITSDLYGASKAMDGIPIIRCKTLFSFSRVPFCPSLLPRLLKEKCDIIHAHLPLPSWDLAVSVKKMVHPKTKLVTTIHNYSLKETAIQKILSGINNHILMKFPLFFSDKIITTTEAFALSLDYKIPVKKLEVIPLGVNLSLFKPLDLKRDTNLILFVGRLIPEKGLHLLVEAVQGLGKNLKFKILAICAETYDFNDYENKIKKDGQNFLTILKNIPQQNLPRFYSSAGFLAFPSYTDSFGFVLIEAMACGCPVIASDLPGPASIVKKNGGIVFEKKNVKALQSAILSMATRQEGCRENGMNYVKQNFTWEIVSEKILALYESVTPQCR